MSQSSTVWPRFIYFTVLGSSLGGSNLRKDETPFDDPSALWAVSPHAKTSQRGGGAAVLLAATHAAAEDLRAGARAALPRRTPGEDGQRVAGRSRGGVGARIRGPEGGMVDAFSS